MRPIRLRPLLSPFVLLALAGCGAGAPPWEDPAPVGPLVEMIEAPAEDVFGLIPELLRRMGFGPGAELDPSRLTVESTQWITFRRSVAGPYDAPIVRCQVYSVMSRGDADDRWLSRREVSGPGTMTVRVEVSARAGGSVLRATLVASPVGSGTLVRPAGTPDEGSQVQAACATTGVLESQIAEAVRAALDPDYEPPAFVSGPRPF